MRISLIVGVDGNRYVEGVCPCCGGASYALVYPPESMFDAVKREFDMPGKFLVRCRHCAFVSELSG